MKTASLVKQWLPKKTKVENPFKFYVGVLEKYSKKRPKQLPVALTYQTSGPKIPTHQMDTRTFLL